jgi:predicted glutamine amidotransferase
MCIIVGLKPNINIEKCILNNCWQNNPEGSGFAYNIPAEKKIVLHKGFLKFKEFYGEFYNKRKQHPNSWFLLHFRKISRGNKSKENCHPFYTHKNKVAIAHNGTIWNISKEQCKEKSDSRILAEMLSKFSEKWVEHYSLTLMIDKYIGIGKLAVLTTTTIHTFKSDTWVRTDDGILFSNESYKKTEKKTENVLPFRNRKNVSIKDYCRTLGCTNYLWASAELNSGYCYSCLYDQRIIKNGNKGFEELEIQDDESKQPICINCGCTLLNGRTNTNDLCEECSVYFNTSGI